MSFWKLRTAALVAALALLISATTGTEVRSYRYSLDTRSGDSQYVGQIPSGTAAGGRRFEVETDARGRITRVASFRDGRKISETIYRFNGDAVTPSGFQSIGATGEVTGRSEIQRNDGGERTRISNFTVQGQLTDYIVRTYATGLVESIRYTANGSKIERWVEYYSPAGIVIRQEWHPDDVHYYDTDIDEATGLSRSRKEFRGGRVLSSNRYIYDADGTLRREDIHDPDGNWYGAREYSEGLKRREFYEFSSEDTREALYAYDEKSWVKEVKYNRNGNLVCKFVYDWYPNGTIKRTLAIGPHGDLMAEYPDQYVDKVQRDGQPLSRTAAAIIHKKDNWW